MYQDDAKLQPQGSSRYTVRTPAGEQLKARNLQQGGSVLHIQQHAKWGLSFADLLYTDCVASVKPVVTIKAWIVG